MVVKVERHSGISLIFISLNLIIVLCYENYLLTLIGLLFAIGLSAQTVKVTGTVLDEGRQPLLGVSILCSPIELMEL